MIEILGFVIYLTVVGIGLLDLKSGLGVLAVYRSAGATDLRRREAVTEQPPSA